ncbi:hypothetical protein HPB47_005337 [Ixodes persulcatus]|uniref:Uncharacterized protein n=1 Tax=Ixodes persulcatus TaxID=34615 RepID=A0AC60PD84_IXOPE|nr:hypothetical protein HPB47_005337 [Ixodes persulcatus]
MLITRIWLEYSNILPTLEELDRRFQLMENRLNQYYTPCFASCTSSDVNHCWLMNFQHSWNILINPGGLELRCHSPGRLCFTVIPLVAQGSHTEALNMDVFNLLVALWLVNNHECIDFVDINTDNVFGDLSLVFFRMVQLGWHHQRLKVVSWLATRESAINDEFLALALGGTFSLDSLSLWGMDLTESSTSELGLLISLEEMLSLNRNIEDLSYEINSPVRFPFEALAKNRCLKKLRVGKQVFDEDDIKALADTLWRNKRLRTLSVAICPLEKGDALWRIVAAAIGANAGLKELDLRRSAITDQTAGYLADALKSNRTLKKLDVTTDTLTAKAATYLAESLRTNTTLEELRFGRVWGPMTELAGLFQVIKNPGVSTRVYQFYSRDQLPALIKLLRERCQLPEVHISGALECPPLLATMLFFAVRVQKHLTRLSISLATNLESHSARHLAILFSSCKTLKDVNLNVLTRSAEIMTLADGIGQSGSISRLRIRSWLFDFQSADAFLQMLKNNNSVIYLTIYRSNKETNHLIIRLREVFEGNYSLLEIELFDDEHVRIVCPLLFPYLRLNYYRLTRAAGFFEGAYTSERAAGDFRRLAFSRPLMNKIKDNTESSEEEIMAAIKEMLARLDD